MKNKYQFTMNIPTHTNDGAQVPLREIQGILNQALDYFGGYTYDATAVQGAWRDPDTGKVYIETVTRLSVAVDNTWKGHRLVVRLAEYIRMKLEQECVFLVCPNGSVKFV